MREYSVGIPVRNEENTLEDCVESVLNQTLPPREVLICINGSTDRSMKIAQGLSNSYSNVRVLESDPGKPNAWHSIADNSLSSRIMFIDGDVKVSPNSGMDMVSRFDANPDLVGVGGTFSYQRPKKETLFSRLCIDGYERPIRINFLTGSLYMLDLPNYQALAERNEVPSLPNDIINDDAYIFRVCQTEPGNFEQDYESHSEVLPILTFSDAVRYIVRITSGEVQFRSSYSDLYEKQKSISGETNLDVFKKRALRLNDIDSLSRKLGCLSLYLFQKALMVSYSLGIATPKFDNVWEELPSTKIGFNQ